MKSRSFPLRSDMQGVMKSLKTLEPPVEEALTGCEWVKIGHRETQCQQHSTFNNHISMDECNDFQASQFKE